jgi:hypothetical protein
MAAAVVDAVAHALARHAVLWEPRARVRPRVRGHRAHAHHRVMDALVVATATTRSPHRVRIWAVSAAVSRSARARVNRTRCAPASI